MLFHMTKIFQPNPSSLRNVHIFLRLLTIGGLFLITNHYLLLSLLSYYILITIGVSIMMHRYFSHKSFEFNNKVLRLIFIFISILSLRGSPMAWAYVHKKHHENVDTLDDPHTPIGRKIDIFGLADQNNVSNNIKLFKIRTLITREQILINEYYYLIVILSMIPLALINFDWFYYGWLIPVVLIQITINLQNFVGHIPVTGSYCNYTNNSSGQSQNNILLWPLYLGEAWHNNHHSHPGHFHYGSEISGKWWEFDPAAFIIKSIKT